MSGFAEAKMSCDIVKLILSLTSGDIVYITACFKIYMQLLEKTV